MKRKLLLIGATLGITIFVGCGADGKSLVMAGAVPAGRAASSSEPQEAGGAPATEQGQGHGFLSHGVEFKEGRGLTVPSRTGEMLGLKIVDVEEGRAARRIDMALQVFQHRNGFALASGPVDATQASFLKPGMEVTLDQAGKGAGEGEIVRLENAAADLTGMAEVIVRVPASGGVKIGSFMDGEAVVPSAEDVVVIPREALLKTAEGYFVYVENGDSLFRTQISVGGQAGELVEVTDGLYYGDRVVLQPIMPLWLAELQAIRGGKACVDGH